MMIVDAVNSAPTAPAVYFLVTAYLESLRHFNSACAVPEGALHLPVAGSGDLRQRLGTLERDFSTTAESAVANAELAAVIRSALSRLEDVGDRDSAQLTAAVMHCARSDSPHSSLSV